ncbi:methyltransferase [Bordetella pertussis]|nr:methyltransferase [Bordetella pertussis]
MVAIVLGTERAGLTNAQIELCHRICHIPANPGAAPADGAAVQALLAHWEQALVAVGFLDPAHPKKLMPRMKHLLTRSALSRDEVDMLRGVCTAMIAPNRPK